MILIPENEDREFKYGILPNKLKYTIIYDKNSDTSNVVMSVRTGSLYEPLEFMGLAHFLEHMLFMGSKKYTDEDYFSAKLKELGGSSNAYTDNYQTVYYFNVLSNNLEKIIDIFSRFFIDPLFDINSVSREINAVNSEHLKNYNNDGWILRQIILNLAEKDNIINRFSTGSHETLGSDIKKVRDAMIKFYDCYYCSNNMTLTIQSNKPIKDIEKLIKKCFCDIKEKKVIHPEVPIKKYKHYNKEYQLTAVRDINSIVYFWELPDFNYYKDNKIINIISNTIILNCKKNLQNALIEANLISDIGVGYTDVGIFMLSIDILPNINFKYAIYIINDMVRYYFNNLKNYSWNKIYDYNEKIYELSYNNRTKENNMDLATNISNNMHYYAEPYIYSGSKLVINKEYNKLYKTLELLTFDKTNIIYVTNKKLCDKGTYKIDKYYGKKYCLLKESRIPKQEKTYDFNIHIDEDMLKVNPKVIKNLDKYNKPIKLATRYWYGGVSKFKEPIVIGEIIINYNKFFNTIVSYITTIIAIHCINYYMQLLFCNEIDIGNTIIFTIDSRSGIITLSIIGFNYNFIELMNKVISEISKISVSNSRIETELNIFKKGLQNADKLSPWEMTSHVLLSMVNKYINYYKDELREINKITHDMVKKRINKIIKLQNLPLTTVIYGNINYNKELKNCLTYKKNLDIELDKLPKQNFPKNITIKHPNKDEVNCCISFVFSIFKGNNFLLSAKLLLLVNIIERPAFDELRTKAQLGYLVACKLKLDDISYIKLSVQSAKKPELVEDLMNIFINIFVNDLLNNMSESTFKQIKKSLYNNILDKDNSMLDMANNYTNEISIQDYIFDRKERVAEKIKEVSLNDIKQLYHSIIKEKSIIKII
jgi:insulysin